MFPDRYFAPRYFANHYFPVGTILLGWDVEETQIFGPGMVLSGGAVVVMPGVVIDAGMVAQ